MASTTETLLGTPYTTAYSYDDQSGFPLRVKEVTYPSGYAIEKGYDATTGNVTEIRHNNQLLWKTHEANALGQITHYEMGNGVHSYYQYDDRHLLSAQQASKNGNIIQNFGYSYDIFANLAARTEDKFAMPITETFTYDYLNRLTTVTLNGSVSSDIAYDAFGRILSKEADGQTVFSGAQYNTYDQYNNLKPHAISSATMDENQFASPSLDIAYTMFDKVKTLSQYDENEVLVGQVAYQYGYDHERIQMSHGNTYEKLYLGNCELITQNGNTQWNTFISGPLGVFAAVTSNGTTESLRYIYKDHLGSWTTITDDAGTILEEMSYDAWGNIRIPGLWTNGSYSGLILYDRGFTGHEHLFSFGLINMNGRMYDPVMSSFLSVDNYVQRPDFSQSFNRYAYCLNNPLRYVDPDGEWFLTGGVGFGKREDGTYGLTSVSVGVNFGFFGFGVNLGFDRGFSSVGVYGELGPHIGCAGANLTLSVGYDFRYQTTTASLSAGYGFSYGVGRAGVGASASYTWGGPSGMSPWNANVSASLGLAWSVNKFGQMAGLGIGCSYGTQGWGFGAHSYCEILPLQEKLDRIVNYYNTEIAAVGENDASFKVGSNHNLSEINQEIYGDIYDNNGEINRAGHDNYGITVPGNLRVGRRIKGTTIYLSKNTIKKIWNGSDYFKEVMLHECQHASDFYTGEYQRYGYSERAIRAHMESRAYMGNYYRTGNTEYLNLAAPYLRCVPTPNLKPINVFSL